MEILISRSNLFNAALKIPGDAIHMCAYSSEQDSWASFQEIKGKLDSNIILGIRVVFGPFQPLSRPILIEPLNNPPFQVRYEH